MSIRIRNDNYWKKRSMERLIDAEKNSLPYLRRIKKLYRNSAKDTVETVRDMYRAYYKKDGSFDINALEKIANKGDLKRFQADLKREGLSTYLPEHYRGRLNRAELLNAKIWAETKKIAFQEQAISTESYTKTLKDTYYKSIYDTSKGVNKNISFAELPQKTIDNILNTKFYGENYSQRVWHNTGKLANKLQEVIGEAILTGQSLDKTKKQLLQAYGIKGKPKGGYYDAERLIRTETNYFENRAEIDSYEEMGIKKFKFLAVLDMRTSEICREHDGKIYNVSQAVQGENTPPLHPNCRSTIVPYIGKEYEPDTRIARDPQTGKNMYINNMDYQEWFDKYVKEGNYTVENAFSEEQYNKYNQLIKDDSISGKVLKKYNEDVRIIQTYYNGIPHFDPNKQGVYFDINKMEKKSGIYSPYSTIFHELGHNVDYLNNYISNRFKINDETIDIVAKREVKSLVKKYKNTQEFVDNLSKELKTRGIGSENYGSLSDIISGSTGNRYSLGIGHRAEYWIHGDKQPKEIFAEYFSANLKEDKTEINLLKEKLPETSRFYDKIIREIWKK